MTKKSKAPPPIVTLGPRGIMPLTQLDAEEIGAFALGTEFDLVKRSKRSNKHLRTYWKALGGVVKATGIWPTRDHLHNELLPMCGFFSKFVDWETGEVREVRDSVAFENMMQDEFNQYFKVAMEKLAARVGYDPLRFMDVDNG